MWTRHIIVQLNIIILYIIIISTKNFNILHVLPVIFYFLTKILKKINNRAISEFFFKLHSTPFLIIYIASYPIEKLVGCLRRRFGSSYGI